MKWIWISIFMILNLEQARSKYMLHCHSYIEFDFSTQHRRHRILQFQEIGVLSKFNFLFITANLSVETSRESGMHAFPLSLSLWPTKPINSFFLHFLIRMPYSSSEMRFLSPHIQLVANWWWSSNFLYYLGCDRSKSKDFKNDTFSLVVSGNRFSNY